MVLPEEVLYWSIIDRCVIDSQCWRSQRGSLDFSVQMRSMGHLQSSRLAYELCLVSADRRDRGVRV